MIEIFELVEAPVDRAGFMPALVEGVASPNWLLRRFGAHVASGAPVEPDTDRRWAATSCPYYNQANTEIGSIDV
jgi:hypothetical protein